MASIDQVIRKSFPGASNTGLRAKIRERIASPVDELDPQPPADRVRNLAHTIALTAQGRASLETVAAALESR